MPPNPEVDLHPVIPAGQRSGASITPSLSSSESSSVSWHPSPSWSNIWLLTNSMLLRLQVSISSRILSLSSSTSSKLSRHPSWSKSWAIVDVQSNIPVGHKSNSSEMPSLSESISQISPIPSKSWSNCSGFAISTQLSIRFGSEPLRLSPYPSPSWSNHWDELNGNISINPDHPSWS